MSRQPVLWTILLTVGETPMLIEEHATTP